MKTFIMLVAVVAAFSSGNGMSLMDETSSDNTAVAVPANQMVSTLAACTQNYSPCSCNMDTANGNAITVTCINVADVLAIRSAFGRVTDLSIYKFEYYHTTAASVVLPADLFSDKKVSQIHIGCPKTDGTCTQLTLKIEMDAFRFTRRNTLEVHLKHITFDPTATFDFLNGFEAATTLIIDNYMQIPQGLAFENAPFSTMVALTTMAFTNGRDTTLGTPYFPDITPVRLLTFNLTGSGLDHTAINNNILLSLAASSSASSIEYLGLRGNLLDQVPKRLQSFSKTKVLDMGFNNIPTIGQSRLNFPTPPTSVDLQKNLIATIDAGAFVGDFSKAKVNLANNTLTTLSEGVFKGMLQQMSANLGGFLDVSFNSFSCDCTLAWLFRDNRHLIPFVKGGKCCIFGFEDISATSFSNC